jgi:hypothetical protein
VHPTELLIGHLPACRTTLGGVRGDEERHRLDRVSSIHPVGGVPPGAMAFS